MALLRAAPAGRRKAGLLELAFVAALLASAFLVRLWPVRQVHFWGEAVFLQNAEVICCGKHTYSELSFRPPLLSILFAAAFRLSNHQFAASLLTAVLNALAPVFLYWAGRILFSRAAAGIAALLLAFSPFFAGAGNSLLTDSPALTLVLLAYWVLLEAVAAGREAGLALAGFLTGLAGLMQFDAIVVLAVFPLYWTRRARAGRATLGFGAGLAAALVPYLAWSWLAYGPPLANLEQALRSAAGPPGPVSFYVQPQNLATVFTWVGVAGIGLWFVTWLLDTRIHWKREGGKLVLELGRRPAPLRFAPDALLWWWIAVVLAYLGVLGRNDLRYLMLLAAPWLLLAGAGLGALLRQRSGPWSLAAQGVLVLALGHGVAPTFARLGDPFIDPFVSEEKQVADYLDSLRARGVLYVNFNYPVFAYYTHFKIRLLEEKDVGFHDAYPGNMPSDGYVVLYKAAHREPTPPWADANPRFRRLREFPSLIVYDYRVDEAS